MGTMPAKELLKLWKTEDLTVDMAVGHILQHLVILYEVNDSAAISRSKLHTLVDVQSVNWANLKLEINRLLDHVGLEVEHLKEAPKRRRGGRRKSSPDTEQGQP